MHGQHAAGASQRSPCHRSPKPWHVASSLIGVSAAVKPKIVCSSKRLCCLAGTYTFSVNRPILAPQDTGALAAAGYGLLVVWARCTLFSGLEVASKAA